MTEPKVRFKRDDGADYSTWKQGRFGDLIEVYDERVSSDSTLPVLTSSKTDGIQYQSDHFGREQLHDITGYNVIPRGYCTYRNRSDGTDFTFNINNICDKGIVSKFYPVFRANDQCNLYFLMTLMNNEPHTVRKIAATAKGTGQKVLSFTDLQKIEINIPCLEEQHMIADFLSSVDEVIAASEQEVANLEMQKKAVIKKIFSQEVRFKREDGTDFPEWEETTIDKLCYLVTKQTGFDYSATIKPALKTTDAEAYPYLQTKNFSERDFNYNTDYYMPWSVAEEFPKLILNEPLLLFSIVGASVGNIAFFPGEVKCFLSGAICVAKFKSVEDIAMTYYYMLSYKGQDQIKTATKGGAQATITIEDIRKFMVLMPSPDEKKKIVDLFTNFDEAIAAAKKELELWKELKKGMLQQMFV